MVTSAGDLPKRWIIGENGVRSLIKAGRTRQESDNERIAYRILGLGAIARRSRILILMSRLWRVMGISYSEFRYRFVESTSHEVDRALVYMSHGGTGKSLCQYGTKR